MPVPHFLPSFEIKEMIGKTFTMVRKVGDELHFLSNEGDDYIFHHYQSCCESVAIEDIVGDLSDLENSPMLEAEESGGVSGTDETGYGSHTWTFYKFGTIKGHVNVRWLGESNGYYSESVDMSVNRASHANH